MKELIVFKNSEFGEIRIAGTKDEPWFCAADLCKSLGYANPRDAVSKHVDERDVAKRDTPTASGVQSITFVNESGLYALAFCSKLPNAKEFRHLVTSEILPQIRKTGAYRVKRRYFPRPMLWADPPSERKSNYPIDRGGNWELFYKTLQQFTTLSDIADVVNHTKKPRSYILEVLRGRKMSWRVLGFLTERANYNKVYGIEGHLPVSITKPSAMREQKESMMEKLICIRTPKELEEERQKPINDHFSISFPIL